MQLRNTIPFQVHTTCRHMTVWIPKAIKMYIIKSNHDFNQYTWGKIYPFILRPVMYFICATLKKCIQNTDDATEQSLVIRHMK